MTSVQVLHLVPVDSSSTVLRASHLLFSIRDLLDLELMRSSLKISAIKLLDSLLELCATANNQDSLDFVLLQNKAYRTSFMEDEADAPLRQQANSSTPSIICSVNLMSSPNF